MAGSTTGVIDPRKKSRCSVEFQRVGMVQESMQCCNMLLRHEYMMVSFPRVNRWGRDVHCIVGVLGSATTRYDLVITRKRDGLIAQC